MNTKDLQSIPDACVLQPPAAFRTFEILSHRTCPWSSIDSPLNVRNEAHQQARVNRARETPFGVPLSRALAASTQQESASSRGNGTSGGGFLAGRNTDSFHLKRLVKFYEALASLGCAFGTVCTRCTLEIVSAPRSAEEWNVRARRMLPSPWSILPTGCRVVPGPFIRIVRMKRFPDKGVHACAYASVTRRAYVCTHNRAPVQSASRTRRDAFENGGVPRWPCWILRRRNILWWRRE